MNKLMTGLAGLVPILFGLYTLYEAEKTGSIPTAITGLAIVIIGAGLWVESWIVYEIRRTREALTNKVQEGVNVLKQRLL